MDVRFSFENLTATIIIKSKRDGKNKAKNNIIY